MEAPGDAAVRALQLKLAASEAREADLRLQLHNATTLSTGRRLFPVDGDGGCSDGGERWGSLSWPETEGRTAARGSGGEAPVRHPYCSAPKDFAAKIINLFVHIYVT